MKALRRIRALWILRRHPVPLDLWHQISSRLGLLQRLTAVEKARLRELVTLFLHDKRFSGVQGLELSDAMCLVIAAQACLPVLGLGYSSLSGWTEVIVYPGAFRVGRDEIDADGVVHHRERVLAGESWSRGPLIVSWEDVERDLLEPRAGHNVVIHEIAHKLDLLNGYADGFPPLHRFMDLRQWTASLAPAYQSLARQTEHHRATCINPYAAASPGEFFAVLSEYFFSAPEILQSRLPDVFRQLQFYYRQHPHSTG